MNISAIKNDLMKQYSTLILLSYWDNNLLSSFFIFIITIPYCNVETYLECD